MKNDVAQLLTATKFAADRHRRQRRKDVDGSPYINHPIDVAETLWTVGGVRDLPIILAAILHDTVEDTETSSGELEQYFGPEVRSLVEAVTDDKSLPKEERKRLQIEHAPHLSIGAKQIKLADKISNIRDVGFSPPNDWDFQRRSDYLTWADQVVNGLRGCNVRLEELFDKTMSQARAQLEADKESAAR